MGKYTIFLVTLCILFLGSFAFSTDTIELPVSAGSNLVMMPLAPQGSNYYSNYFEVPVGTSISLWNRTTENWDMYTNNLFGWSSNFYIKAYEGFIVNSPSDTIIKYYINENTNFVDLKDSSNRMVFDNQTSLQGVSCDVYTAKSFLNELNSNTSANCKVIKELNDSGAVVRTYNYNSTDADFALTPFNPYHFSGCETSVSNLVYHKPICNASFSISLTKGNNLVVLDMIDPSTPHYFSGGFDNIPAGTTVYIWNGSINNWDSYTYTMSGWSKVFALRANTGFIINVPSDVTISYAGVDSLYEPISNLNSEMYFSGTSSFVGIPCDVYSAKTFLNELNKDPSYSCNAVYEVDASGKAIKDYNLSKSNLVDFTLSANKPYLFMGCSPTDFTHTPTCVIPADNTITDNPSSGSGSGSYYPGGSGSTTTTSTLSITLNSCKDSSCSISSNTFYEGDEVYLKASSTTSNVKFVATLTTPSINNKSITLPYNFIADEVGDYTFKVVSSKTGYTSKTSILTFSIRESQNDDVPVDNSNTNDTPTNNNTDNSDTDTTNDNINTTTEDSNVLDDSNALATADTPWTPINILFAIIVLTIIVLVVVYGVYYYTGTKKK